MKTYVLGDVHGGAKALQQVLEKANFDNENDRLISVGDLCDGWPETLEVIEILMDIKNLVFVRGNHDDWTIQFLKEYPLRLLNADYHAWRMHGGKETEKSYEGKPELAEKHLEFLKSSLYYYIDEQNRLYVHAGYTYKLPIESQPFSRDYTSSDGKSSYYFWDRTFWSNVSRGFMDGCDQYKEIYIGHTPTISNENFRHGRPANVGNVWNMDTGAAFMGKLSLMNVDTKELYQSDIVFTLYPESKGRNGKLLAQDPNWNKWGLFEE
jgi:serine/threonine protein phosphatase 1